MNSYSVGTQFSTHVFDFVAVPSFDANDPSHMRLVCLSHQAHEATAAGDTERVQEIEAEIDELAAELWGLTKEELREIRESLEELG
ncbi:MAG: hypothetical protein J7M34_08855 [Anaerolineae bacterium]|nr:hypothetical protein [Anaerolineae bacterium]